MTKFITMTEKILEVAVSRHTFEQSASNLQDLTTYCHAVILAAKNTSRILQNYCVGIFSSSQLASDSLHKMESTVKLLVTKNIV